MRLCIFEDSGWQRLQPITLTRPAFALWCGAERILARQARQLAAAEVGFWVRPSLVELWPRRVERWRLDEAAPRVNDAEWLGEGPRMWVNGRWLPSRDVQVDPATPHAGMVADEIAYVVLPAGAAPARPQLEMWLGDFARRL